MNEFNFSLQNLVYVVETNEHTHVHYLETSDV